MRCNARLVPYRRLIPLLLLCAAVSLLVSGCAGTPDTPAAPTATPVALPTVDPSASGDIRQLEENLLAGAANALKLEIKALSENSDIASVRVPDQILNQFLDALQDEKQWKHEAGRYTLAAASGGDYVYEKPYSNLITGSSTDVYTIEDDEGRVEEIVDNTRFDPFTWVMSGEGGGEFAYMTVYSLVDNAGEGTIETVSQLNGQITGWSYDAFAVREGRYCFFDVQLSPDEEGLIASPYQWILCIGDIGAASARIEEIMVETGDLILPMEGLDLSLDPDTLMNRMEKRGTQRSLLTLSEGNINYSEHNTGK